MAHEGFHEIQLNGKQLVFLFMAATVVSVVIFLSGVMAGRSLRADESIEIGAAADVAGGVDPTAPEALPPAASPAEPDGMPVSAQENLTYSERLESPGPVPEKLRASVPDAVPPVLASEPVEPPAPAAVETVVAPPEPRGNGYVVQVMAARTRTEAERIARRLTAKGYPTFVSEGPSSARARYRVRVGKYNQRREAESVGQRLKNEEQFNIWITR